MFSHRYKNLLVPSVAVFTVLFSVNMAVGINSHVHELIFKTLKGNPMEYNHSSLLGPYRNPILNKLKTGRREKYLVDLEEALRKLNLWENPQVQLLYRQARFGTDYGKQRAFISLIALLFDYKELAIELGDPFMPYLTREQISNHDHGIHILDQFHNNIPLNAPLESLPLGWVILGRQGGGKSSAALYILSQCIDKGLAVLVLDPKGTWKFKAEQLAIPYVNAESLSLDLCPPTNIKLDLWLYAYMEGIAEVTGLQYSISYLYQACDIAMEQRRQYKEKTGEETPLCLKDIYMALQLCNSHNSKQSQYLQSAQTALEMLLQNDQLFSNRGGLPVNELLNGNYILGCRYLSATRSRLVAWHILAYEYFRSFGYPETTRPRGIIFFDDSSKFVSKPDTIFSTGGNTSSYLHILSNIRSTGRAVVFIDQVVDPIFSDIKQLSSNWLVVGGLQGANDLKQVASAMNLTPAQTQNLVRLQTREAVCFVPKLYPQAVHGFIPLVSDINRS